MISQQEHKTRRAVLLEKMQKNSVAIIPTSPEVRRTADQFYRYYPDNDFLYLTGYTEPESIAILEKDKQGKVRYVMFNRKRDPKIEQWVGRRSGQQGLIDEYHVDEAYPIGDFSKRVIEFLADKDVVYCTLGRHEHFDVLMREAYNDIRFKVRGGVNIPNSTQNLEYIVSEMRLIKSTEEITLTQRAADISVEAHKRAMRASCAGKKEYEIWAELVHEFYRHDCAFEAYGSIVASGENACILHYEQYASTFKEGDLVLIDAGGHYHFYSADITRTFPVNGKFSAEQKAIYDIVLKTQEAVIDLMKPGLTWNVMNETAERIITEGLVDIGLLKGRVDDLIAEKAFMPFYMHRIGHWLGIDVHDVGHYKIDGQWRELQAGMMTTVEPGIYIKSDLDVDERFKGIGVRIEDNILVTESGARNMTQALPSSVEAIERLMAERQVSA